MSSPKVSFDDYLWDHKQGYDQCPKNDVNGMIMPECNENNHCQHRKKIISASKWHIEISD